MVYDSKDFTVKEGVAIGDALSIGDDLVLDDFYRLATEAQSKLLTVTEGENYFVSTKSDCGGFGNRIVADAKAVFMDTHGAVFDITILVEVKNDAIEAVYFHTQSDFVPGENYRLVSVEKTSKDLALHASPQASFVRGTLITIATGEQIPIENLNVGDAVLTRESGAQPIRFVRKTTVTAQGTCAPILIKENTYNNANDLMIHPDHQLFIGKKNNQQNAWRNNELVTAGSLVDGVSVVQVHGGYVDYFAFDFDREEVIFAEGLASESRSGPTHTPMNNIAAAQSEARANTQADQFEPQVLTANS